LAVASLSVEKTAFVVLALGGVWNISGVHIKSTSRKASLELKHMMVDHEYPGTAVKQMLAVRARVSQLTDDDLNGHWEDVRRRLSIMGSRTKSSCGCHIRPRIYWPRLQWL
jgi:hypothetical protein